MPPLGHSEAEYVRQLIVEQRAGQLHGTSLRLQSNLLAATLCVSTNSDTPML
jgi:hypothetical protein